MYINFFSRNISALIYIGKKFSIHNILYFILIGHKTKIRKYFYFYLMSPDIDNKIARIIYIILYGICTFRS